MTERTVLDRWRAVDDAIDDDATMGPVACVRAIRARRDFYREWRDWHLGGDLLAPDEYQLGGGLKLGPLTAYASVCQCGERHISVYLSLPAPRRLVRRVWLTWFSDDRPRYGYQQFPRPRARAVAHPDDLLKNAINASRKIDAVKARVASYSPRALDKTEGAQ